MNVYLKTGTMQVTKNFRTHFFSLTGSRWQDVKRLPTFAVTVSVNSAGWTLLFSLLYKLSLTLLKLKNYLPCCATEKHFFKPAPPQIHDNAEDAVNTASQLHESTHAH